MTYKDLFVAEVKCKGRILRIKNDTATLPFGSEYSILLKNLNSRRASVNINIDGEDVLNFKSIILDPNESVELQGFLDGNVAKNRFKFIQKTQEIQNHRGDKIDDGLIRIEFSFEKEKPVLKKTIIHETHIYRNDPFYWNYGHYYSGDSSIKYSSSDTVNSFYNSTTPMSSNIQGPPPVESRNCVITDSLNIPNKDEGITVKGSECNQEFSYSTMGELDPSQVIIINLKGTNTNGQYVSDSVTVKTKLQCSSCGKKSKSSFKYCSDCGTFLE